MHAAELNRRDGIAHAWRWARHGLGGLFLVAPWLFPFWGEVSPDALPELVHLGCLAAAVLCLGSADTVPGLRAALLGLAGLLVWRAHFPAVQVAAAAALLLALLATRLGARLRADRQALLGFLFATVAAALLNALQGLLQWPSLGADLWPWVIDTGTRGVAYGATRHTNVFASLLCAGLVCCVWLVRLRALTPAMAWWLNAILVLALVASGSRTGVLEVLALGALALLWRRQLPQPVVRLLLGASLLLLVASWLLPWLAELHGFGGTSAYDKALKGGQSERLLIWRNALQMIAERPLWGWGWREFGYGHYASGLADKVQGSVVGHAHNLPLQLAAELGLPVALMVCAWLAWVLLRCWPRACDTARLAQHGPLAATDGGPHFAWALLFLLAGVHSFLELPLWHPGLLFLAAVCLGYLLPGRVDAAPVPRTAPWVWRLTALALIALAVFAYTQYRMILAMLQTPFNDRPALVAAVERAQTARLYQEYARMMALGLEPVTQRNAAHLRDEAEELLHYSAEPMVIATLLESQLQLQDRAAVAWHAQRFCHSFARTYRKWSQNIRTVQAAAAIQVPLPACPVQP